MNMNNTEREAKNWSTPLPSDPTSPNQRICCDVTKNIVLYGGELKPAIHITHKSILYLIKDNNTYNLVLDILSLDCYNIQNSKPMKP
jgi:hypothetical protein